MSETTLQIERLDGGLLVIGAAPLAFAFFDVPIVRDFEDVAGTRPRYAITLRDIELLNSLMGARTPHHLWEPLLGKRRRWLQRLDSTLDLITTSERRWRSVDGGRLIEDALIGCVGHGRNIAVATKLLHLKRPGLFPILDSFVVELLGGRVPVGAEASGRARDAAELVLHLRREGRANIRPLREIQRRLGQRGTDVPLIRILDAVLWSSHPAAGGIATRRRVFRSSIRR